MLLLFVFLNPFFQLGVFLFFLFSGFLNYLGIIVREMQSVPCKAEQHTEILDGMRSGETGNVFWGVSMDTCTLTDTRDTTR